MIFILTSLLILSQIIFPVFGTIINMCSPRIFPKDYPYFMELNIKLIFVMGSKLPNKPPYKSNPMDQKFFKGMLRNS